MKSILFTTLFILSSCIITAQEIADSENIPPKKRADQENMQTISQGVSHSGFYGSWIFRGGEFKDNTYAMTGLKFGWIINRSLSIGFEGQGIIPTAKIGGLTDDSSEKFFLLGGYGGLVIEPIIFSNRVIHLTFPVSTGAGWLGYHEDWENNYRHHHSHQNHYYSSLLDDDVFWYIEPGVTAELNITRHFRMNFGVSKRFTQDLELINTSGKDFNNLTFMVGFKVGRF